VSILHDNNNLLTFFESDPELELMRLFDKSPTEIELYSLDLKINIDIMNMVRDSSPTKPDQKQGLGSFSPSLNLKNKI